jgi:hypothetical protein
MYQKMKYINTLEYFENVVPTGESTALKPYAHGMFFEKHVKIQIKYLIAVLFTRHHFKRICKILLF